MSPLLLWGLFLVNSTASAKTQIDIAESDEHPEFRAVQIAGPFEFPSSIAFLPGDSILVAERTGRLLIVKPGSAPRLVSGVPRVLYVGHAGLIDVALDPEFDDNGIVYLSHAYGAPESSAMRVTRARLDLQNDTLAEQHVIFQSVPAAEHAEQSGGRMAVTADGHLFLTLGDRRNAWRAQDLSDHAGSIIRIRTDGSVPQDNPFVAHPGARPEIWSYGHRNPQGLVLDRRTGRLWSHEHGPLGGDELNLIIRGGNYGWPVTSHGVDYSGAPVGEGSAKEDIQQPIRTWTPAIGPSGMAHEETADGSTLWVSTLVALSLIKLELAEGRVVGERRLIPGELGRIRDVRLGPDGFVHFVTDHSEGTLYRAEPFVEEAKGSGLEGTR